MLKKYQCKDVSKTGNITLPNKYRQNFGLYPGNQVEFLLNNNSIIIKQADEFSLHNKRYISQKGAVHIPKELRQLTGIHPPNKYCLYIDEVEKRFILELES
ncbi:bifunctional DNA-binding transcriptional regulator/antitoxin component of YhaV-PrlF toxin-antitoxin module [Bacillus pakistanensis]|uniref:Bifunctional DNA-binding transcriptional regulator/antitoxin component of YhaV-PrlF toxin-antitoxin module n=1 Tax=Rossellomorea pakistanensis TaxID=992288 RepID=A0ABS2NJ11_9BACI|nr:AbrB/MazE/SpoVT family DNA-binding domain-containing protein [Bacillus pakistanensis]MBM7587848.1 bifunctional DNA-binding transcriptional regulator/antitoxin component of YhaV-PrlF toxin-antitoxin module [Bacillus pakistanensis]